MTKKNSLAVGIILFVAVALASYFVMLPGMKVQSYKKTATAQHDELHSKLDKVVDLQYSDMFVQFDPPESTYKSDAAAGKKVIKEAEDTLAAVRSDLTTIDKLPATEWTGFYKPAEEARNNEEAYIKEAEAFISEVKDLLAYMEKQADFVKASDDYEKALLEAGKAETNEDYVARTNAALKIIEPAIAASEKHKAPESMKDLHAFTHKTAKEMIELVKQSTAALLANDTAKFNALLDQQFAASEKSTKEGDKLSAEFARDSKIRKLSDSLAELDRSSVQKLAGL